MKNEVTLFLSIQKKKRKSEKQPKGWVRHSEEACRERRRDRSVGESNIRVQKQKKRLEKKTKRNKATRTSNRENKYRYEPTLWNGLFATAK